jgi:hypothetical protein
MPTVVAMRDDRKNIFIIGPMAANGTPLGNIFELKKASEQALANLAITDCSVDIPQEQYGNDIPTDVFHSIDLSELIIADISARSPSVIYELAMAHALGIPTILIDDQQTYNGEASKKPVFYLNQARILRLETRSIEEMRQKLEPLIRDWNNGRAKYTNPLTRFYDLHLVDVSAIAGIAAGYAENFVKPIMDAIADTANAFGQAPGVDPPLRLVVVLPKDLDNLAAFESNVMASLEKGFPGKVSRVALAVKPGGRDKRTVIYVEGVVIDLARTLFPIRRSKRLTRLKNEPERSRMEKKLIANFKVSLENQAHDSDDISQSHLRIVRLNSLVATVKGAKR